MASSHPSSSRTTNANIDARLSTLEANLANLAHSVEDLADVVRAGSKAPWQPIVAAMGVAVTIIIALGAAFGSGYIRDQARLELQVSRTDTSLLEATKSLSALANQVTIVSKEQEKRTSNVGSIAGLIERMEALNMKLEDYKQDKKEALAEQDRRLQQEMRLLNEAQSATLQSNFTHYSTEIGSLRATLLETQRTLTEASTLNTARVDESLRVIDERLRGLEVALATHIGGEKKTP